ncbi:hypothetical protein H206_02470 [Candidatus Electrothrix aarhusensis]|uniref:Uncharacterized protein n=1 Tax=Candidatus Electrothrix aarhusensis TaxID=1859131 RepID=A0A3S3QC19_9BACT|nr:hypothetical protein H206_02470 [Candidatus Electrothrix aarhusensis]
MKMSDDDIKKKILLEPDYLLERIDNEVAVYHPTLTTSLYLNETGALSGNSVTDRGARRI